MTPDIFWIPGPWPGRLAVSARPRGGDWLDDELREWRSAGIDVVVSLLTAEEEQDLSLGDEGRLANQHGIRFISFPIVDRGVPSSIQTVVGLIGDLRHSLETGRNVAIHCRQGLGRSPLIAAATLVSAGVDPQSAFKTVGAARGVTVPETPEQQNWLEKVLMNHLALARH